MSHRRCQGELGERVTHTTAREALVRANRCKRLSWMNPAQTPSARREAASLLPERAPSTRFASRLFPGNPGFNLADDLTFALVFAAVSLDLLSAYFVEFSQW